MANFVTNVTWKLLNCSNSTFSQCCVLLEESYKTYWLFQLKLSINIMFNV